MTALSIVSAIAAFSLVSVAMWRMAICQRPPFGVDAYAGWLVYGLIHLAVVLYAAGRLVTALSGEFHPWPDVLGMAAVATSMTMSRKRSAP